MISYALVERFSKLCLFEELYRTYSQGMYQIALASVDKGIHNKTTKYGLPTY